MKWLIAGLLAVGLGTGASAQQRSQVTDEIDLMVLDYLDEVQRLSIRDNREYCGVVGYDATGRVAISPARPGDADSCDPGEDPPGFETFASYHTHGAWSPDADAEVPSIDDLIGDFEERIDGYISTPSGRVWVNSLKDEMSFQLCGPGCVRSDPNFRPCPAFPPAIEYTIETLEDREDADTGEC